MENKLCKNCVHYSNISLRDEHNISISRYRDISPSLCKRYYDIEEIEDLVYGGYRIEVKHDELLSCYSERHKGICGKEGKFFSDK